MTGGLDADVLGSWPDCAGWVPADCPESCPLSKRWSYGAICWDGERCIAMDECTCLTDPVCYGWGFCDLQDGECKALRQESCSWTLPCVDRGKCSVADGHCVATDASCRAHHDLCAVNGLCHANAEGFCVPGSNQDCLESAMCKAAGYCTSNLEVCCSATKCPANTSEYP